MVAFLSALFHALGMETTGERIKRLREEHRWTQKHLALLMGVSSKTIGNWENDRNIPRSSLAALEVIFREPMESAGDPVEKALRTSELIDWRQDAVLSVYKRNLHEQRSEESA